MEEQRHSAARTAVVAALVLLAIGAAAVARHESPASAQRAGTPVPDAPASRVHRASAGTAHASPRPHGSSLDLSGHSTTNPSSIWVVVNKSHPIQPLDFRPRLTIVRGYQVAVPAARPLTALLRAGDSAGLGLKIASAFRSYGYQDAVHDALVAREGSAAADRVSARPGFSEHQTGLAVDLVTPAHPQCDFAECFATTPAGRWLATNAWRYGFIVRYTARNRAVTGYRPEPWHLRYVGRPLATTMRATGVSTLEQVFHVEGGGDYR